MTVISRKSIVSYPISFLHKLVLDIEKYPEFIPWCTKSVIKDKKEDYIVAELTANFKGFTSKYNSLVTFKTSIAESYIQAKMISGPMEHLYANWRFLEFENEQNRIEFELDYKFKSSLLENISKIFLSTMADKIMSAFLDRAKFLYATEHE